MKHLRAGLLTRADDSSMEGTLVKAPNYEPCSEQAAEKELIIEPEPEEESVLSTNINYEVDSTRPIDRPRREVRASRYLQENV